MCQFLLCTLYSKYNRNFTSRIYSRHSVNWITRFLRSISTGLRTFTGILHFVSLCSSDYVINRLEYKLFKQCSWLKHVQILQPGTSRERTFNRKYHLLHFQQFGEGVAFLLLSKYVLLYLS